MKRVIDGTADSFTKQWSQSSRAHQNMDLSAAMKRLNTRLIRAGFSSVSQRVGEFGKGGKGSGKEWICGGQPLRKIISKKNKGKPIIMPNGVKMIWQGLYERCDGVCPQSGSALRILSDWITVAGKQSKQKRKGSCAR